MTSHDPITACVVSRRSSPNCVKRQKKKRESARREAKQEAARRWCVWPSQVRAIQTLMSGKRNEVIDAGIVEVHSSGSFGPDDRQFDALRAGFARLVA